MECFLIKLMGNRVFSYLGDDILICQYFRFFVVLLNFRKCRSNVLFHKFVILVFAGFVLYLCQIFICLMTLSIFLFFLSKSIAKSTVHDKRIFLNY